MSPHLYVSLLVFKAGQFSFYRPLLVILDRQVDMATPLHHTWTYQALAHDVLRYSLNRVTITEGSDSAGGAASQRKTRVCDLDSKDQFWNTNKGVPFPQVPNYSLSSIFIEIAQMILMHLMV